MNWLVIIPSFFAVVMLGFAFYIFIKVRRPYLGAVVTILPIINLIVDVAVVGDLTVFRQVYSLVQSALLIWVLFYNVNRKKL